MATTSPLRQRMIEDMTIRNLSPATQQSYIYAVRKFSRHFGTSPDRLGIEDVRAYQLHLIAKKRSWSHINQAACALRFFFGVTMGQQDAFERIVNGREPEKLPPVLAPDEIARFLEAVVGLRNRVALTTAYAAGLRIGEVCRLKVTGKGGKDRYARARRWQDAVAQLCELPTRLRTRLTFQRRTLKTSQRVAPSGSQTPGLTTEVCRLARSAAGQPTRQARWLRPSRLSANSISPNSRAWHPRFTHGGPQVPPALRSASRAEGASLRAGPPYGLRG